MSYYITIEILGILTDVCFRSGFTAGEKTFSCAFEIDEVTFEIQFKKNIAGAFIIDGVYSALFTYSMDDFDAALVQIEAGETVSLRIYHDMH